MLTVGRNLSATPRHYYVAAITAAYVAQALARSWAWYRSVYFGGPARVLVFTPAGPWLSLGVLHPGSAGPLLKAVQAEGVVGATPAGLLHKRVVRRTSVAGQYYIILLYILIII